MAQKVYIKDLAEYVGKEVTLRGWLHNKRSSGKVKFLILRDGSGLLQCIVFKGNVSEEVFETADKLTQESSFEVTGLVKEEPRAVGGFELDATDVKLISPSVDYPITPKEHGIEFLIDHRHLWLRSQRQAAILRIRHRTIKAIRDFFDDRGFVLFDPPILTPNACEGTSTLFETEYFDLGPAYLTQSGQLYAEAGAMALGKVYTFGPTFRAEKSKNEKTPY
jgi:asparaginyl-tRNA synthetase